MLNIGDKIVELRKCKNWPQSDLAKAANTFRDIIGKYEWNENSPSIEMALKIAKAIDIPVDYLIGGSKHTHYDNDTIKRVEELQVLGNGTKSVIFNLIDAYIRDAKARIAYTH